MAEVLIQSWEEKEGISRTGSTLSRIVGVRWSTLCGGGVTNHLFYLETKFYAEGQESPILPTEEDPVLNWNVYNRKEIFPSNSPA